MDNGGDNNLTLHRNVCYIYYQSKYIFGYTRYTSKNNLLQVLIFLVILSQLNDLQLLLKRVTSLRRNGHPVFHLFKIVHLHFKMERKCNKEVKQKGRP